MLLQPLVENALVHGVAKLPKGGTMSLAARQSGGRLHLVIRNDVPRLSKKTCGGGVGLANVRERLRVIYGPEADLRFERGATEAMAIVIIPSRKIPR
jgi:LytS/YehU family sensor histidine kinase